MDFALEPENVILSRCDRMGDVILSSACIPLLRQQFPKLTLCLLAKPPYLSLFQKSKDISGLIPFDENVKALTEALADAQADTIIHLHPNKIAEQAAAKAGIPNRIGLAGTQRGRYLTHPLPYKKKTATRHEALYAMDPLQVLGFQPPPHARDLQPVLAPNTSNALATLSPKWPAALGEHPYATIAPHAHENKPSPPAQFVQAIADYLINEHDLHIVLVGGEAKKNTLQSSARIHDLRGKTTMGETAALMAKSRFHFSRDTGPAHLAAALGVPTVVLFMEPDRYNRSARWHPLGPFVTAVEHPMHRNFWESRHRYARRNMRKHSIHNLLTVCQHTFELKERFA